MVEARAPPAAAADPEGAANTGDDVYRHTQTGTVILAGLGATGLACALVLALVPLEEDGRAARWIVGLVVAILLAVAWVFRSLTIEVRGGVLSWSFGPGAFKKTLDVSEIEHVEPTRPPLLAGWGIHWTARGWLYNVAGRDAVWIRLRSGKQVLLGTDEPERLAQAIRAAKSAAGV